jgi:hypothetical protein
MDAKARQFVAPDEDTRAEAKPVTHGTSKPDINDLKNKFLKKK